MDLRGDYTCMRAHELLKKVGSKPGWHYVTQSIYYRAIGGFLFVFRIDRGDFKLRRFCRDKACKSRVVAEVRSQTRTSISRFRRGNFARVFAALKQKVLKYRKG